MQNVRILFLPKEKENKIPKKLIFVLRIVLLLVKITCGWHLNGLFSGFTWTVNSIFVALKRMTFFAPAAMRFYWNRMCSCTKCKQTVLPKLIRLEVCCAINIRPINQSNWMRHFNVFYWTFEWHVHRFTPIEVTLVFCI